MKKVIFFVILILCLFIINNFFHSIYSIWQKQDLITQANRELSSEKQQQRKLKEELRTVEDPSYVEEEARNRLFLVKPGEQLVVLPEPTAVETARRETVSDPDPAWQQWYRLFF